MLDVVEVSKDKFIEIYYKESNAENKAVLIEHLERSIKSARERRCKYLVVLESIFVIKDEGSVIRFRHVPTMTLCEAVVTAKEFGYIGMIEIFGNEYEDDFAVNSVLMEDDEDLTDEVETVVEKTDEKSNLTVTLELESHLDEEVARAKEEGYNYLVVFDPVLEKSNGLDMKFILKTQPTITEEEAEALTLQHSCLGVFYIQEFEWMDKEDADV